MTLTPRRKRIGKKLARWGSSSAVGECLEDPDIRQEVVTALGDMVEKELKQLCSKKVNSIQRTTSAETIKQFNWSSIITEARVHAPILLQLLSTLSAKKSRKKKPDKSHNSVIGVLLCVLCKHRNPLHDAFPESFVPDSLCRTLCKAGQEYCTGRPPFIR